MELIGMLDSPYVRRVAISLQFMGLRFTHQPLSVFRTFEQFAAINPVVKAPTLVCDDGTVLMDSSLILDYAEQLSTATRPLWPADLAERRRVLRVAGLALAACEKSVQLVYETLRPPERRHEPWMRRVNGQLLGAYRDLEAEVAGHPLSAAPDAIDQAGICTAVAWRFTREMVPAAVPVEAFPCIDAFSAAAERLPQFQAAPYGAATYGEKAASP